MTLVLAMGTLLPLLLPLRCTLSIISCCIASCCMYPTVFFSQDLGDDAFASLGTSCSVSENCFECVPRSRQLDPNCASKKLVHNGKPISVSWCVIDTTSAICGSMGSKLWKVMVNRHLRR